MHQRLGVFLVALGLGTGWAFALTDEEVFTDFRFNMINPGARSLALGGAFISLADDATAAQANPAGLSYLLKQEFFIELRGVDNGSRVTNLQLNPLGDRLDVLTGSELTDDRNLTFASAVFPIGRVTLGLSRQAVLNNQTSTLNSFFFEFTGFPSTPSLVQ